MTSPISPEDAKIIKILNQRDLAQEQAYALAHDIATFLGIDIGKHPTLNDFIEYVQSHLRAKLAEEGLL